MRTVSNVTTDVIRAIGHNTLSYYFYREGDHERSQAEAERALSIALTLVDDDLLATAHNLIGLNFATRLRPRKSLVHFEQALEHARNMAAPEFRMLIELNLASSYTYLGRAEESLALLQTANERPTTHLYPTRSLVVQSMLAQAKATLGRTEGVEQALTNGIAELEPSVLPDSLTFAYIALGLVQLAEQRPRDALVSFDRVLEIVGKGFSDGFTHPRIQLLIVPYAIALRESGSIEESKTLLDTVIERIPESNPDQLLVDATTELAKTLAALDDSRGANAARDNAERLESILWDDNFHYQVARLSVSLELDKQKVALERAQERQLALQQVADREAMLRRQTWLIGAMLIALIIVLFSRRLHKQSVIAERAANERLEELVDERTQELSDEMAQRLQIEIERRKLNDKLTEGEKMRILGQLTAGVAHDFNNLMSVVTLTAENLKFTVAASNKVLANEMIDDIIATADSGAKITDGLLAYVRKQPLKPEALQLDQHLKDTMPILNNTLGESITLTASFERCSALVDKGQLTTTVLNLILNAKDAMPDGGELVLQLKVDGERALISVQDSGTGIPEDALEHVFEPFFTTKDVSAGTGLGLSMAYGFARQSGGDLLITSTVNEGTTVTLVLPVTADDVAQQTGNDLSDTVRTPSLDVLVVEDRDQLRGMLRQTLEQLGMQVRVAANTQDALSSVNQQGLPELLIADIMLPGGYNGAELSQMLRERKADLPVLLISGYSGTVDSDNVFLRKPFSMNELERAIAQAIQQASEQRDQRTNGNS
ncbi:MAG: tetratricopeptide repeat protein [Pseudomonadota bacterium]